MMLGPCCHDQPDNCVWGVIVEGCPEITQSINLDVDRGIGSAAFHGNLLKVEQAK